MRRGCTALLAVAAASVAIPGVARAFPEALGTRATGMGDAGVADARSTEALRLNPAGMSLASLYSLAADYQFMTKEGGQAVNATVADSTSDTQIGGGLFYGYRSASPAGAASLAAHEAGLALSYPISERLMIGATAKYVHVAGGLEPDGQTTHSGFTADAGLELRLAPGLTVGVSGHNLHDLSTVQAPVTLGYGIAASPGANLTLVVDAVHDFTTSDATRGTRTSVGGGAELLVKSQLAVRAGGGYDAGLRGPATGYVTAGLAALSELGAVAASVRQDLGSAKTTTLLVSLQLFVQSPRPTSSGFLPSATTTDGSSGLPTTGVPPALPSNGLPPGPSSPPELH